MTIIHYNYNYNYNISHYNNDYNTILYYYHVLQLYPGQNKKVSEWSVIMKFLAQFGPAGTTSRLGTF